MSISKQIANKLFVIGKKDNESLRKVIISLSSLLLPQIKDELLKTKLEKLIGDNSIENHTYFVSYHWDQLDGPNPSRFKTDYKVVNTLLQMLLFDDAPNFNILGVLMLDWCGIEDKEILKFIDQWNIE